MATSSFKSTTRRASLSTTTTNDESSSSSSASSSSIGGTIFNAQGTTNNNIAQSRARTSTDAQGTNNIAQSRGMTSTSRTNEAQGTNNSAQSRGRTSTSTTSIAQRRARSLSRFSQRGLGPGGEGREYSTPKGKFVNMKRGSEFVDLSLDDLALEFFGSSIENSGEDDEVGGRRSREVGRFARDTVSSKRRGRSVSRQRDGGSFGGSDAKSSISNGSREANSRRGRSISRQRGDGEVFRGTDDGKGLVSGGSRGSLDEVNSRRGRSISRQGDFGEVFRGSDGKGLVSNDSRGKVSEADLRRRNRRRSLSVVRYQVSDSEVNYL